MQGLYRDEAEAGEIADFEHFSPFYLIGKVPSSTIIDPPVSGESRGFR
jgi:hypothetical protein